MSSMTQTGAGTLLRQPSIIFFLLSRSLSRFSSQIGAVAIGWQVYDMTGRAFDLGMVGLVQFLPTALLVFVAGHAADRFERKRVIQLCQVAEALTALFLAWGSWAGWITELHIFIATFVLGTAGAFESPATAALLPLIAPQGTLQRATALSSGAIQIATITGPALGGLAYAFSPGLPYGVMLLFWLFAMLFTGAIRILAQQPAKQSPSSDDVFAGVRFIRSDPAILGTISLDLFAVLFGGVTALLPIYARDILQAGPFGLGVLRAAPAVGALLTTIVLARHTISRRVGMRMFQAVIIFGVATVVFALSHWMWLSLLALAALGAADTVSVVIRFRWCSCARRTPCAAGLARSISCSSMPRTSSASSRAALPRPCSAPCRPPCSAASPRSQSRCCGCGCSRRCAMSRSWNDYSAGCAATIAAGLNIRCSR
jgi:MFS family permease